jgi:hypothetical protein
MLARLSLPALRSESGITLIEFVVSMAILFAVGTAWSMLMTTTAKTGGRVQELANLQTEVRGAVDDVAGDLRQAACNGTTLPISTATGTQLTFYTPDRATPYHLRQVSYRLVSDPSWSGRYQLERAFATSSNTDGPPWTIPALGSYAKRIGSVTNAAAFAYKDANGTSTTTASAVASVIVTLTVAPHAGLGGASATYSTSIDLRALSCS